MLHHVRILPSLLGGYFFGCGNRRSASAHNIHITSPLPPKKANLVFLIADFYSLWICNCLMYSSITHELATYLHFLFFTKGIFVFCIYDYLSLCVLAITRYRKLPLHYYMWRQSMSTIYFWIESGKKSSVILKQIYLLHPISVFRTSTHRIRRVLKKAITQKMQLLFFRISTLKYTF